MTSSTRDHVILFINGLRHELKGKVAFMMLANFLRTEMKLVGTKIVCAEGDCGACTVLCYRTRPDFDPVFIPINACIVTVAQLDGCHIMTIESLKRDGQHSAVQEAVINHHASQCGFCTPGFVMAMTGLFEKPKELTEQKVKNGLTGNLCRCTGYQPLIQAAMAIDASSMTPLHQQYLDKARDQEMQEALLRPAHLAHERQVFFAPTTIDEAIAFKCSNEATFVINGGTDLGVASNKGKTVLECAISLHLIDELSKIYETHDRIIVGARASLEDVRRFTKNTVHELSNFLNIFASPQIKHVATLAGNVANGSPIGDTLPFLMVSDGRIHCHGTNGAREIDITNFYQGYKKLGLLADEIITHVSFQKPKNSHRLRLEKTSQRKDLDISIINCAFLIDIDHQSNTINQAKIAFGGIDAVVRRLEKTEKYLASQVISSALIEQACVLMQEEISPISDLRGSDHYRRALADGLFRKFMEGVMNNDQGAQRHPA